MALPKTYAELYDRIVPLGAAYRNVNQGRQMPPDEWSTQAQRLGVPADDADALANQVYAYCSWNGSACQGAGPDKATFIQMAELLGTRLGSSGGGTNSSSSLPKASSSSLFGNFDQETLALILAALGVGLVIAGARRRH